jgi:putative RecB family exonuclease
MGPIIEADILSLTPSKVRDYQACPHQYMLKTTSWNPGNYTSPALSFGNSIHSALEEIHARLLPADVKIDCREVLRRHWVSKDYSDDRESELHFARGVEALGRYLNRMSQQTGEIIGTEIYLSRVVRLSNYRVRLGCKVDRLELRPDDSLEALDYKTNSAGQVPTKEFLADDLATFIYYVLVRIIYPEHPRVIVSQLNVLTLAKVEVEYDGAKITAHKQGLTRLVGAIQAGEFDPRPGGLCAWCRVRDRCPASEGEADLDNLI